MDKAKILYEEHKTLSQLCDNFMHHDIKYFKNFKKRLKGLGKGYDGKIKNNKVPSDEIKYLLMELVLHNLKSDLVPFASELLETHFKLPLNLNVIELSEGYEIAKYIPFIGKDDKEISLISVMYTREKSDSRYEKQDIAKFRYQKHIYLDETDYVISLDEFMKSFELLKEPSENHFSNYLKLVCKFLAGLSNQSLWDIYFFNKDNIYAFTAYQEDNDILVFNGNDFLQGGGYLEFMD